MGMRTVRMWASLIGLSCLLLVWLNKFPGHLIGDEYFQASILSYVGIALGSLLLMILVGSQSFEYFRFPRIHFRTFVVILLLAPLILKYVTGDDIETKKLSIAIPGVMFLLMIGVGEEFFSRGFVFGVFRKYGQWRAIWASSFLFGLLHLNLYIGADWDPWQAYAHVWSTFSFGVLACAVMITTRSIWMSIILHALLDWGVVFTNVPLGTRYPDWQMDSLWEGFTYPLFDSLGMIFFSWILLRINRGGAPRIPRWAKWLAIKFKLVHPPADKHLLIGEN
jgi:membrane protease YdiL (CAAX protease family)